MPTNIKDGVWFEKYRPTTLEEACYPQRIHTMFKDGIDANIMLIGSAGNGKTTLARILSKGFSVLKLNGSSESGIDIVRNQITDFCSISGFDSKRKIVYIDEADSLSQAAQTALRGTIEKYHQVAYFIFTCNYPEKFIPPILSRFVQIKFNLTDADEITEQSNNYIKRIVHIANAESLTVTKGGVMELMKRHFPDFRSIINTMQEIKKTGNPLDEKSLSMSSMGEVDVEFYQTIMTQSNPPELYKYIKAKFMNKEHKAYAALSSSFLEYLMLPDVNKSIKVGDVAACVHKYQYEQAGVIDKLVSLCACCFELNRITR